MSLKPPFLIFVGLLLGLTTCTQIDAQIAKEKPGKAEIRRTWVKAGWKIKPGWSVVTEDSEVEKWGKQFQERLAERDYDSIMKELVDNESVAEFVSSGIGSPEYAKGFKRGSMQNMRLLLEKISGEESFYRFQRVVPTEFGPGALMRFVDANMAVNYHIWRFQKNDNNKVIGLDFYIFASGESVCDSIRRVGVLSAPKVNDSLLGRLMGRDARISRNQELLSQYINAVQTDARKTLDLYWKLPQDFQKEKFVLLSRIIASQKIGDDEYQRALEDMRRFYPKDPINDLMILDLLFLKKEFDKYFKAVENLEKIVGPDAHLQILRYGVLSEQKKLDEAEAALKKAMQLEPDYENVLWTLAALYVEKDEIKNAVDILRKLAKDFDYIEFDYKGVPGYEKLQESKLLAELNAELAAENSTEETDEEDSDKDSESSDSKTKEPRKTETEGDSSELVANSYVGRPRSCLPFIR